MHRSRRRARLSGLYFALLVVQIVNATFWLVPNAYVLAERCRWYNPPVQWCATPDINICLCHGSRLYLCNRTCSQQVLLLLVRLQEWVHKMELLEHLVRPCLALAAYRIL